MPSQDLLDGGDADAPEVTKTPSLRVATLNLRCMLEEWDARLPMIVAELAQLQPEVVALQEVCREEGGADALEDLVRDLETATGREYHTARADTHLAWDVYQEGIALLSVHPLLEVEVLDLPVGVFPRKAVIAQVASDKASVQFAVTHLSFGEQETVRNSQLTALRERITGRRQVGESVLLAGDMNEGPGGAAIVAATEAGFQDSWAFLHADEDGSTYPASNPRARIDYILHAPGPSTLETLRMERFLIEPADGRHASDHLGLWAEFGK